MTDFRNVIAPNAPQGQLAPGQEVSEAKRAPNVASDVTVPLLQAFVTAVVSALCVAVVAGGSVYVLNGDGLAWQIVGLLTMFTFGLTLARSWILRLAWVESTIKRAESMTGVDFNGDGEIEHPPHFFPVRTNTTKRPVDRVEQERQRLTAFVLYAFENGTSVDVLQGRFSREEIGRFRALLMQPNIGCAEWVNPRRVNLGWRFVGTRDDVLRIIDNLEAVETIPTRR